MTDTVKAHPLSLQFFADGFTVNEHVVAAYREYLVFLRDCGGVGSFDGNGDGRGGSLSDSAEVRSDCRLLTCGHGGSGWIERIRELFEGSNFGTSVGGPKLGRNIEGVADDEVRTSFKGMDETVRDSEEQGLGNNDCGSASGDGLLRGRHWKKNKTKKEKKKAMARSWRSLKVDGSGGCISEGSTASVCTVDTRTAVEIQAVQSLAARRVVENQIAIARGKMQLKSFGDKAKTDALQRLAAARMEQRINEAKAKSQASFKKCDESLKSLGSTGSAGEFAMRCEVQKARRSEDMLKYVQEQADILAKYASPEVLAMCREVKPPEPIDIFEIFGECSSDLSPEEAAGYYEELQRMQEEEDERSAVYY